MLFIDNDEPQITHWSEDAAARSHHYARTSGANSAPLFGALGIAERAVKNGHAVAEARVELPGHRGRERDFRHQQQSAAA